MKDRVEGMHFNSSDELLGKLAEIISSIPKEIFLGVFEEWKRRLAVVVKNGGEYFS